MLEKELKYYRDHQDELVAKYQGKYIIIIGEEVKGVFDTEIEAYANASNDYEPGTFFIQQCLPGSDNYTQTYHSRAIFE